MYSLFLVCSVALVILSPIALELWLSWLEARAERRRLFVEQETPGIVWASDRIA
jgi:hypothetical protein